MKQRIHRDQPPSLVEALAEIQRLRHRIEMLEITDAEDERTWWNRYLIQKMENLEATHKIAAQQWQRQISLLVAKNDPHP